MALGPPAAARSEPAVQRVQPAATPTALTDAVPVIALRTATGSAGALSPRQATWWSGRITTIAPSYSSDSSERSGVITRNGTPRGRASVSNGMLSTAGSMRSNVNPSYATSSYNDRCSSSHRCGARAPGDAEDVNSPKLASGGSVPSDTMIGELRYASPNWAP